MTARNFDWRDLPALHRYRNESVFMDSALLLTRGEMVIPGALFSFLAPSMGVITAVNDGIKGDRQAIIGQVMHFTGSPVAHLTFVTPDAAFESQALPALLEYLIAVCGGRGALRLLADVDESTLAFEALRRASFAIYTRQRIWQLNGAPQVEAISAAWRPVSNQDLVALRSFYNNLVPGLVQQVEPFQARHPRGMVLYEGSDLRAFVELKTGPRGTWAQPFFHPDALQVSGQLADLVHTLNYPPSRPLYLCVRSYQSWLETAMEELGAQAAPRQGVMVKNMAIAQKVTRPATLPVLEGTRPEITAHIELDK